MSEHSYLAFIILVTLQIVPHLDLASNYLYVRGELYELTRLVFFFSRHRPSKHLRDLLAVDYLMVYQNLCDVCIMIELKPSWADSITYFGSRVCSKLPYYMYRKTYWDVRIINVTDIDICRLKTGPICQLAFSALPSPLYLSIPKSNTVEHIVTWLIPHKMHSSSPRRPTWDKRKHWK